MIKARNVQTVRDGRLELSKNSSVLFGGVETGAPGRNGEENFSKEFVEIINRASSCENDRSVL